MPRPAKQWTNIVEVIRPHLQPTLDWMEMHRAKIIANLDQHIQFATYEVTQVARGTDKA